MKAKLKEKIKLCFMTLCSVVVMGALNGYVSQTNTIITGVVGVFTSLIVGLLVERLIKVTRRN